MKKYAMFEGNVILGDSLTASLRVIFSSRLRVM